MILLCIIIIVMVSVGIALMPYKYEVKCDNCETIMYPVEEDKNGNVILSCPNCGKVVIINKSLL